MKKRLVMSITDMSLIELADILISFWIVALLLTYKPVAVSEFFIEWTWAFFALAVILGIRPLWKVLYGEKSAEGKDSVVKKTIKKGKKKVKARR